MGAEAQPAPASSHRMLTTALVTVATILAFFACFAVWANRQALNTDHWTSTSSKLLENKDVQDALSVYLVNQLYASANVQERLEKALPSEVKGLSGPVAAGLRQLAGQAVPKLLATAQVQELWRQANRNAHKQLLAILNGGGNVVSTSNGEVILNLHQLVTELAGQLGLGSQVEAARAKLAEPGATGARESAEQQLGIKLPPESGRSRSCAPASSRRHRTSPKPSKGSRSCCRCSGSPSMRWRSSWRRGVAGRCCARSDGASSASASCSCSRVESADIEIVDSLVKVPANKPAGEAVWSIGTSLLRDISIAMVLYGLVLVAAAWLAGRTRVATTLRHAAAPWMREHAVGPYLAAGVLLLLVVLWGPTPATRQWLPVLGFAALAALGVTVLRRQTQAEFPDAPPGEAMAVLRGGLGFGSKGAGRPAQRPEEPAAEAPAPGVGAPAEDAPVQKA